MPDALPIAPDALVRRFLGDGVQALALLGSHARGDAGPWSDVDLVCFVTEEMPTSEATTHLIDDHLVVVNCVTPNQVERWFTAPEEAVRVIIGLRQGQALADPVGVFAAVQARAQNFTWDATMQSHADRWASQQMVGWIEEVHKGLAGLHRGDSGRLLFARHGLSWGMLRILTVQQGILLASENDVLTALAEVLAPDTSLLDLLVAAFGMAGVDGTPPPLRAQVIAGLRLYARIADRLAPYLTPDAAPLIARTAARIRTKLSIQS
jgi:hypothetical protein